MTNQELKIAIKINDLYKREQFMRDKLSYTISQLKGALSDLQESEKIKYSGWSVLLKKKGRGFECVGIVDPDSDDNIPEDFDIVLPIPKSETLPEFNGF